MILNKKGARIAHKYVQSHILGSGGIEPFLHISCAFGRQSDSHLSY